LTLRPAVRRLLLAGSVAFLLLVGWMTLSGAIRQAPRSLTLGQQVETAAQLVCGLLSVLSAITCFRWRRWNRHLLAGWAASLAIVSGLSSLVWGPPDPIVALVFAALALLLALGTIRLLRAVQPSLGLESGTVQVVPYDAEWPKLFRSESSRIAEAIKPLELRLEHTGSTAVPGLAAKPVLDILAGYTDPDQLAQLVSALQRAGYVHRGPQGIPEREFFRRGEPRAYHVHLTLIGSRFWRDHLVFRDRLREDPSVRDAYAALKLRLAAEHPRDREAYIAGKTGFVRGVLGATSGGVAAEPRP
jgi:GrpB-like predicted nucleotidyltransferase (UPF0157 family)